MTDVLEALDSVTDPELDRSIVELEYVDAVDINGAHVLVRITLPTAWCSPAFAWMMIADARDAIETAPTVEEATVVLEAHMHDEEITRGVNDRRSFAETFSDADGDLEAVRAELDEKARTARQYDAVETLLDAGLDPAQIVDLRGRDLESPERLGLESDRPDHERDGVDHETIVYLHDRTLAVSVPTEPLESYLEKARDVDVVTSPDDVLFRTPEGDTIHPEEFDLVHRRCRLARVNMSVQGGVCSGLHEARQQRLEQTTTE